MADFDPAPARRAVSYLCPGRTGPTHVVSHPLLSSFRRRLHATRTWCTPELVKVVEKGHTLVKIHEVCHFPPEQRRTGLFADYVNTWLKLKTRIGRVAELVSDRGAETGLYSSLPGTGGHPTRYCQHCQKFRTQGHGQVDTKQVFHPFFSSWIFLSFFSFFLFLQKSRKAI